MAEKGKTAITVNDKEYFVEDMTDEQRAMLNHINDLGRKLDNARFNLDQLAVGRDAFVHMLTASLPPADGVEQVEAVN
jgi:hypothetical protein